MGCSSKLYIAPSFVVHLCAGLSVFEMHSSCTESLFEHSVDLSYWPCSIHLCMRMYFVFVSACTLHLCRVSLYICCFALKYWRTVQISDGLQFWYLQRIIISDWFLQIRLKISRIRREIRKCRDLYCVSFVHNFIVMSVLNWYGCMYVSHIMTVITQAWPPGHVRVTWLHLMN